MERYRLIFRGDRCGNYAKLPLPKHLELLKISDKAKTKIATGKKISLKSGLTRADAEEQRVLFKKMGLITKRQLQLSPEILAEGMVAPTSVPDEIDETLPVHLLNSLSLSSVLVQPFATRAVNEISEEIYSASSRNYQFSPLLLIIVSIILGSQLQGYVAILFGYFGVPSILASSIGLLFLIASALMFPRLFQPLLELDLRLDKDKLYMYEQNELILGKRRFVWETRDEFGEFVVGPSQAEASSVNTLYQWNAQLCLDRTNQESIMAMQKAIMDEVAIDTPQTIFERLEFWVLQLLPVRKKTVRDWSAMPASIVTQSNGDIVALIYKNAEPTYRIVRKSLVHEPVLNAFCLTIHRAGLA